MAEYVNTIYCPMRTIFLFSTLLEIDNANLVLEYGPLLLSFNKGTTWFRFSLLNQGLNVEKESINKTITVQIVDAFMSFSDETQTFPWLNILLIYCLLCQQIYYFMYIFRGWRFKSRGTVVYEVVKALFCRVLLLMGEVFAAGDEAAPW